MITILVYIIIENKYVRGSKNSQIFSNYSHVL